MSDDDPLSPRPKQKSFEEIVAEKVAHEIVEATGRHKAITSTPPAVREIQKWWLQVSLVAVLEAMGHVLHEWLAHALHWR